MLKSLEDRIKYENEYFYVYEIAVNKYEIRKHNGTHSYIVGSSSNLQTCILTADKLAKYPNAV